MRHAFVGGVRYYLPGVFQDMPLKGQVNGSLWTLPIEMRMYLYLAGAWFVLAALPSVRVRAMTVLAPVATAALLVLVLYGRLSGGPFNAANIRVFMFLAGATMYLWRGKIPLSVALLTALIAALALASFDKRAYFVAYVFCLPLLVVHLAYLPKGTDLRRERMGRFFLWRLHLRLSHTADPRIPHSGDLARRNDDDERCGDACRRCAFLAVDPASGAWSEGGVRGRDVARLRARTCPARGRPRWVAEILIRGFGRPNGHGSEEPPAHCLAPGT